MMTIADNTTQMHQQVHLMVTSVILMQEVLEVLRQVNVEIMLMTQQQEMLTRIKTCVEYLEI